MKFCKEHWDQMRAEIENHNMGHMVSKDAEEMAARLMNPSKSNFDPLMAAHNLIVRAAVKDVGYEPSFHGACPICGCNTQDPTLGKEWTEGAVADVADYVKKNGLLIIKAA